MAGAGGVPRVMAPVQARDFLVVAGQLAVERELNKLLVMAWITPEMDLSIVRHRKQPAINGVKRQPEHAQPSWVPVVRAEFEVSDPGFEVEMPQHDPAREIGQDGIALCDLDVRQGGVCSARCFRGVRLSMAMRSKPSLDKAMKSTSDRVSKGKVRVVLL